MVILLSSFQHLPSDTRHAVVVLPSLSYSHRHIASIVPLMSFLLHYSIAILLSSFNCDHASAVMSLPSLCRRDVMVVFPSLSFQLHHLIHTISVIPLKSCCGHTIVFISETSSNCCHAVVIILPSLFH